MKNRISTFIINHSAIITILVVAAALRLWNISHIPFTYDEFSALFRTRFDSFSEMIRNGARVDGHPAGIQVFLFYWVKLVGFSEPWIKLPFIVAGIASVYLIWRIGKMWFNEQAALFSAACLAMLQFPVIYSQIARPYGSGLFFVLLAAFYWTKIIQDNRKWFGINHFGFAIAGALCAYNHHFSLLMVGIMGLSGFFFLKKKQINYYLLAGVLVFVFYIPHLEIFFHQLSLKGIGQWVAVPTPVFFINYLKYIFEFSILLSVAFALCIAIIIILTIKRKELRISKYTAVAFFWGVLPPLVGYWYSVKIAPLLQFSMLIFSFPFMLLFISSFFGKTLSAINKILLLILSLVMVYTLIFTREHYKYFYHSAYSQSILDANDFAIHHPDDKILLLCSHRPEIADYYFAKFPLPANMEAVCLDNVKTPLQLKDCLERNEFQYAMFASVANTRPEVFAYVAIYFPGLLSVNHYEQGSLSIFSKHGFRHRSPYFFDVTEEFSSPLVKKRGVIDVRFDKSKIVYDSLSQSECFLLDSLCEWGPSIKLNPAEFLTSKSDIVDVCAMVKCQDTIGKAALVVSIDNPVTNLFWQAVDIDFRSVESGSWSPVCITFFYPDFYQSLQNATLNAYLWNVDRKKILIDKLSIKVRHGNKYLYWISLGKAN